jgi:hypothetical protein
MDTVSVADDILSLFAVVGLLMGLLWAIFG